MNEILYYQSYHYPDEARLVLKGKGRQLIGEIVFRDGGVPGTMMSEGRPIVRMALNEYARVMDMVRNESPLFLEENKNRGTWYLRTADELVGENDTTLERRPVHPRDR